MAYTTTSSRPSLSVSYIGVVARLQTLLHGTVTERVCELLA
jgi:hypothetical protein